ncbi:UNVERIFIED_CONTAM: hypothetical protein RMT77_004014 [Armadillidium vulgare]
MKGICLILVISFFGLIYAQTGCFDREGCTFRGKRYDEGYNLTFSCFNLVCRNRVWNFTGIDHQNCDSCHLFDDPHIYPFDQYNLYHWYGLCNYSLSQSAICEIKPSYEPRFAVYADFVHCNTAASCVDTTTYKIDPNTVVTIQHKSSIPHSLDINGNTFSPLPTIPSGVSDCNGNFYPAIIWRYGTCAYIVGHTFSIKACYNELFIYANKRYKGRLVGLCGYYSGKVDDDFVPRGNCYDNVPFNNFAISWLTQVHKKDCDPDNEINLNIKANEIEKSCDKDKFYGICEEQIKGGYSLCEEYGISGYDELLNGDIESCVLDCCFNPDGCEEWLIRVAEMARIACETKLMENGQIPNPGEA